MLNFMQIATCSDCSKHICYEFDKNGDREVYCNDCWEKLPNLVKEYANQPLNPEGY